MDILSKGSYPANKLSNFTAFRFILDNIEIKSMEGFLQSLKFKNENSQKITCSLSGYPAKLKGKARNKEWMSKQCLWWKGVTYKRSSDDYQKLLDRAYNSLYTQNESFRNALSAAGNAVFTHSIGTKNKKSTVLTEKEFCSRLQHLKDYGLLDLSKYEEEF